MVNSDLSLIENGISAFPGVHIVTDMKIEFYTGDWRIVEIDRNLKVDRFYSTGQRETRTWKLDTIYQQKHRWNKDGGLMSSCCILVSGW